MPHTRPSEAPGFPARFAHLAAYIKDELSDFDGDLDIGIATPDGEPIVSLYLPEPILGEDPNDPNDMSIAFGEDDSGLGHTFILTKWGTEESIALQLAWHYDRIIDEAQEAQDGAA